jgi:glycosyltransferase involved in cell wall biosynthesis
VGIQDILLSVCMIVKNEEEFLEKCLASLGSLADEVVIGDTGSTDKTPEIARDWGARVLTIPWTNNFAAARNTVLDHAHGKWILSIDADERIHPISKTDILPAFQDVSKIAFQSFLLPKKGLTPRHAIRIFRNDPRIRYRGIIHENIISGLNQAISESGGEIGTLPCVFDHFGYERKRVQKHHRNFPLLLSALKKNPGNTHILRHLGLTYKRLNQIPQAEETWRKAINFIRLKEKIEARDSLAYIDLIKCLQVQGKSTRLLLDEAIKTFPDNPELFFLNGREFISEGRFLKAIPVFKRLLKWGEEKNYDCSISYDARIFAAHALISLAACHFLVCDFSGSKLYCEKALKCDPENLSGKIFLNLLPNRKQLPHHNIFSGKKVFNMARIKIRDLSRDQKISTKEMKMVVGGLKARPAIGSDDRFTNADTDYLLTRIETYEGLTLLTSNQK